MSETSRSLECMTDAPLPGAQEAVALRNDIGNSWRRVSNHLSSNQDQEAHRQLLVSLAGTLAIAAQNAGDLCVILKAAP